MNLHFYCTKTSSKKTYPSLNKVCESDLWVIQVYFVRDFNLHQQTTKTCPNSMHLQTTKLKAAKKKMKIKKMNIWERIENIVVENK